MSSSVNPGLFAAVIGPLLAPVLYGILLSWALLGLLVHQAHVYYSIFAEKDPRLFRFVVLGTLFLEFLVSALLTHLAHSLLITGWGNIGSLNIMPWSAVALPLGSSVMATVVQLFFAWRIWMLNRESAVTRGVACFIPLLAMLHFGSAITIAVKWVTVHHLELFQSRHASEHVALTSVALVSALCADLLITALMVKSLLRVREKSRAVQTTVSLINHLIIRAVETGAVTAIVALLELVFYASPSMKSNTYFVIPGIAIGRFYSTMLMANLNGRGHFSGVKDRVTGSHSVSTDIEMNPSRRLDTSRRFEDSIVLNTKISTDHALNFKAKAVDHWSKD